MAHFHFVYPWFKTLHFAYLRLLSFSLCYPPLLKRGVNKSFYSNFMSLSSQNKKKKKKQKQKKTSSKWHILEHDSNKKIFKPRTQDQKFFKPRTRSKFFQTQNMHLLQKSNHKLNGYKLHLCILKNPPYPPSS